MRIKPKSTDILAVIILTIIMVALALTMTPVRILALPLVLVLPGYSLTEALFPRRSLGFPERLLFTLGLSLVVVILGGLVLNLTPTGLRTDSWAVFSSTFTLGASATALVRRRGQDIDPLARLRNMPIGLTIRQWLLLGSAIIVVGAAVVISMVGAIQQPRPGFTQLWLLPAGGTQPKNVVRLGVNNKESATMDYRLAVNINGKAVKTWSSINLRSNAQWNSILVLQQSGHTGTTKVEATLYIKDAPSKVYRHVVLWLST